MRPTYYVIELSPRWLTVLLVALAAVVVAALDMVDPISKGRKELMITAVNPLSTREATDG